MATAGAALTAQRRKHHLQRRRGGRRKVTTTGRRIFFLFGGKAVGSYLVMGNDRLVLCSRLSEGGISKMVAGQLLLTKGSDLVDESLSWLTRDCPAD